MIEQQSVLYKAPTSPSHVASHYPLPTPNTPPTNPPTSTITMSNPSPKRITRIATFRFKPTTTPEQKADRAKAFLALYKEHQDLIVALPVGGRPLETPLDLTNVKRDSVWDMGFTVTFKVCTRFR